MIVAVESLINKLEEEQLRKEEMVREKQQSSSQYNDNCSDSDSSFNQVRNTTARIYIFLIIVHSQYQFLFMLIVEQI